MRLNPSSIIQNVKAAVAAEFKTKLGNVWNGGKDITNTRKECGDPIALVRSGGFCCDMWREQADMRGYWRLRTSVWRSIEYDRIVTGWEDTVGDMRWYCGGCLDDMLAWMRLETVPQNKVHGNTNVGKLSVFGLGLRNYHANSLVDSLCDLLWLLKWFRCRTRRSMNIGNSPGSWKSQTVGRDVVCCASFLRYFYCEP